MQMTEKQTEEKELNETDFRTNIDLIVDQMQIQAGSREAVTGLVEYLASEYNIKKPIVRKVATAIFKSNTEDENEANEEFNALIDAYNA